MKLARELLENNIEDDACQITLQKVIDIVQSTNLTVANEKEKMWKSIHALSTDKSPDNWKELMKKTSFDLDSSTFSSLYHFVLMKIVENILIYENEKSKKVSSNEEVVTMSEDEQQIVRYVAGYILFSLTRKWKKISENKKGNIVASTVLKFLESVKMTSVELQANSFLDFTNKWLELVNRGGLILVNDNFFIFIRRIENNVRKYLNVKFLLSYKGEDLRDLLYNHIQSNVGVNITWDNLTRFIPNDDLKKELKRQIIEKWIDIRTRSFVKCYVQIIKRNLTNLAKGVQKDAKKDSVSISTEPAMRKTLI